MTRMRVVLEDVTCWNTEDIHGADSFYVLGAVTCGRDKESIVTKPFQINDGQTFRFPLPNFNTVFYKDVPTNEYLRISLAAFDEDAAKDWAGKYEQFKQSIFNGIAQNVPGYNQVDTILRAASKVASLDKDDRLGTYDYWFPVRSFPIGCHLQNWYCQGGSNWYSNWSYLVRFWICRDSQ